MLVGFVAPNIRIAAIVAQAVKEFGEVQIEVAQEGIHADHVGQGDTEVAAVFVYPAFQRGFLEIAQTYVQGLEGLEELVRHGADGCDADFFGQINIAGTTHDIGSSFQQGADNVFLPCEGVATARAEIGNKKRRIIWILCSRNFF